MVTSALLLATSTKTPATHPVGGASSTRVYVPRLALVVPGSSSSVRRLRLSVTPALAVTFTVAVVMASEPEWAAASTRTASVSMPAKSPVNARVRTAEVSPLLTLDTWETETLGMSVTSSKLAVVTPAS